MKHVPSSIKQYAREDIDAALKKAGSNMSLSSMTFERDSDDADAYVVYANATISCSSINRQFDFTMKYDVDGEDVYSDNDVLMCASSLRKKYIACKSGTIGEPITATSRVKRRAIMAAEFDDEEDEFVDTVDDLSDSVDDIQDTLDEIDGTEIEEDDVDIEVDNNIANHYIAECDTCHGIFVSALVESDQEVEKVSGVCPLCDKETDQYLKFIVRPIE